MVANDIGVVHLPALRAGFLQQLEETGCHLTIVGRHLKTAFQNRLPSFAKNATGGKGVKNPGRVMTARNSRST